MRWEINKFKASIMRSVTAVLRNMIQPMPPRSARICSSVSDQYATDKLVQSLIDIDQQQWTMSQILSRAQKNH